MERRDRHDAGQGAVKDKDSETRVTDSDRETETEGGRKTDDIDHTGGMPERDEEKPQEDEVQSEPNPTAQQSLTKQEQFGEVWKERESTRLAEKFGQRRRRARGGAQRGGTVGEKTPTTACISLLTCRRSSHRSCRMRAPRRW